MATETQEKQSAADTAIARVPVQLGVAPTNVEEGWRLASMMAKSQMVPKAFQGKPEDILVAIQAGIELGLAPFQSLQSFAVINSRPTLYGDGFLALLIGSRVYQDHDEHFEVGGERRDVLTADDLKEPTTAAVCSFSRKGKPTPVTRRFSIADAHRAGLLGKDGPWKQYPSRMLAMRARSWAGRDCFPDVLRGMTTAEEAIDVPMLDAPPGPAEPPREIRRISETVTAPTVAPSRDPVGDSKSATLSGPSVPNGGDSGVRDPLELGPAFVKDVEQFLGGFTLTLSTGQQVDVSDSVNAIELEKFKGTDHKIRVVADQVDGGLRLTSFRIAD